VLVSLLLVAVDRRIRALVSLVLVAVERRVRVLVLLLLVAVEGRNVFALYRVASRLASHRYYPEGLVICCLVDS
jgi:hypothetical protein